MNEYSTTREVAVVYGVTARRILQIAKDRGLTPRTFGRTKVWTDDQILKMRPAAAGRPQSC